jgi:hypothetical protein
VEVALADRFGPEQARQNIGMRSGMRSREEIRVWLDELASLSDKIPPRPGETFSREMIYQDHD